MTFTRSRYIPQARLSQEEMLAISQEINLEFAPRFSIKKRKTASKHKLSPKEMFAISEEISRDFAPKASNNTQGLVILPVDPNYLHVYWNLGDDKLNGMQKNGSRNHLILRIYSAPSKNTESAETKSWFDIAIDSTQSQQKVFLPARTDKTAYQATIGKRYPDNSLVPVSNSNISHVPFGKAISHQAKKNQIVFKPMPQLIPENREISLYPNNSASGRGNNQTFA